MRLDLSKVVVLDWETYYDQDYSLRSKDLNVSEYIQDPRFIEHCVGIKEGDGPTRVVWYEDIKPAIRALDLPNKYLLAHNCSFDGAILHEHHGIIPALYLDTMGYAQALHGNVSRVSLDAIARLYGLGNKLPNVLSKMKGHRVIPEELREAATAYTAMDVDLCYAIFKRMIEIYPEDEVLLCDWTCRQFCDPVLFVDIPRATAELERERARKKELIDKTGLDEDQLQSAAKFAAQLQALGIEPPMKISARTKLPTFAFSQQDEEFMDLVTHEDERVRDLVRARLAAKSTIGETRAERFVKVGNKPLRVGYRYAAAHTLRWGGTNRQNLQNLEKEERDENNVPVPNTGELRKSIIAPINHVLVVADSKQIETRVLAWLAGQTDLLELFRANGDPYCALATSVYGRTITPADRDERAVGKAAQLGLGFYMGAKRFQATLAMGILGPKMDLPFEFCLAVVQTYRRKNHMIAALWRDMDSILYRMLMKKAYGKPYEGTEYKVLEYDSETIWLPNGMGLHYPDLRAEWNSRKDRFEDYTYRQNKTFEYIHCGLLTENVVQALARMIIAEQLLRINAKYRVLLTTHDELVCLARDEEADECLRFMIEQMSIPPAWAPDLPLGAEGGYARNYSK